MGKHKKKHDHKKSKKKHTKRDRKSSTSSTSSSEWVEKLLDTPKKSRQKPPDPSPIRKKEKESTEREYNINTSSSDEWVEKSPEQKAPETSVARDEWMSLSTNFQSTSHLDRRKDREEAKRQERENEKYNPRENVRELNPFWKNGGDGLPSVTNFRKPNEDSSDSYYVRKTNRVSNWRKKESTCTSHQSQDEKINVFNSEDVPSTSTEKKETSAVEINQTTEKDLNILAAKLVKAEIMGNTKLVAELKEKLEKARANQTRNDSNDEQILLTRTDSKGYSRPVQLNAGESYSGSSKNKKRKVETHTGGDRVRYFADDDKYSLKQIFENEKFNSVEDENRQFMQLAGKISKNDDLDDVFTDKIRRQESDAKIEQRNKDKAVQELRKATESLDNCRLCIQSSSMPKHLMISMSEAFYLCLPPQEPLTDGHCMLVPIRHVQCGTQLDENEWSDLINFRKALVKMFAAQDEDVLFFETAVHLNRFPHMFISCVPLPKEQGDLAPIYFKKAIDESETEWASNKKLVSLKDRDIRRAVPKGLPYFCVSFGMEEGYAHVVEDYQMFPDNFAEEIIGGMLDLHHSKWRRPKRQSFEEQSKRVLDFSKKWKNFDFTAQ